MNGLYPMPFMKKIAILGAGLAGLSAAVKLLTEGGDSVEVHLFEQSRFMGGRVSSFRESVSGKLLDTVQHVSMRCCHATMRFLKRTGLEACGSFQKEIVFSSFAEKWQPGLERDVVERNDRIELPERFPLPGNRLEIEDHSPLLSGRYASLREASVPAVMSCLRNSLFLPAPFHLLGSVLRLKFLTFRQRLALLSVARRIQMETPPENASSFSAWLETLGCEESLRRLFWDTLILSAFSDSSENVPAQMAKDILTQMLLDRADGWHLWVPDRPLQMIFHDEMLRFLQTFPRFHFHPLTQIKRIHPEEDGTFTLITAHGSQPTFTACISAVPWHAAGRIFPELVTQKILRPECFIPRTISAVHAWYDRPLFSPAQNLAIPGMTTQWIFRHPWGDADFAEHGRGFYHQLMLSDSDTCCSSRPEIIQSALTAEVAEMFPAAKLLHAKTVCVPASVFSPAAAESARPQHITPWRNLFLAGDWTATGFPATMESAIISGEIAAEKCRIIMAAGTEAE